VDALPPSPSSTPAFAFDVPPSHIVQSSQDKGWPDIDLAEIFHPHETFALPSIPRHVLVVHLSSPLEWTERRAGHGHLGTGGLVILPAEAPSTWHLESTSEVRHLHLYLAPALLQRVAAEVDLNPERVELQQVLGAYDPQIQAAALALFAELRTGGPGGRLYAESIANLLALHLLRRYSSSRPPEQARQRGLSRPTMQQVTAYIEEHLADDLTLAELAAVAGLSPFHFARRFKEAFGSSPHQYVVQRRIERARLLLTTTTWTVAVIAQAVGCASESHLALHFKRLTGLTPRHFR
jgi:AraC family transcriptional regulator